MITSGYKNKFCLALDSKEIFDIEDGSVTIQIPEKHGLGVIIKWL